LPQKNTALMILLTYVQHTKYGVERTKTVQR